MLGSKLNAMSVGTMWVLRTQEQSQFARHVNVCPEVGCCPICGQSWTLPNTQQRAEESRVAEHSVLVVLAEPITDEAQQKLFEACLAAAGWNIPLDCFSLHAPCSSNTQNAADVLQGYIAKQQPECIIVFGSNTAQLIHPEFVPGQIHQFANTRLMVTHHPEEMLNNPALKAQVWADFCSIKAE
jgi:hypothetical protein